MLSLSKTLAAGAFSVATLFAAGPLATSAEAATVLALSPATEPGIQQSKQGPCVIGDPSCNANGSLPEGWTNLPTKMNPSSYNNIMSPEYLVSNLRDVLMSDLFNVQIDVNQQGNKAQKLSYFSLSKVGGSVLAEFSSPSGTSIPAINNGNGFSDWYLSGFSLAGLNGTDKVKFTMSMNVANAGREQFFLQSVPAAVPVPAAGLLMIGGLGGLAAVRRRRKAAKA